VTAPLLAGIALLGGAGAVARVVVDAAVTRRRRGTFPAGTLVVNLSGTLVLGILVGAALHGDAYRLLGTGLLGAYTTFSTWMLETHELSAGRRLGLAALNVAGSLACGIAAVWLGRRLGAAL
jgi:CrcB protein